jgi:CubicO group peptidase (beta-lactamase class C family)
MERRRLRNHLCAGLALLVACSSPPDGPDVQLDDGKAYWPGATWRTASAVDAGIDGARLDALVNRIRSKQYADVHGLVIVKNGYVVLEQYFNGSSALQVHEMQSVTKSVTSLLMGIAIDEHDPQPITL